ncbi:hypothetical protein ACFQT0_19375 [Hymenobacter humi]|uniref:Uncharacterized protein n=1 Tax=Hymenobacter humi TaxID=1411620 RepID=A0ABW2U7M5_9BACT
MSTELNPEADQLALANKWLDITVERFVENMLKLRITDTRTLLGSFQKQVVGAASGRLQMRLSYALYGQFVDMGVGRGMGKGVKKADDGYDRIRKTRGQPAPPHPQAPQLVLAGDVPPNQAPLRTHAGPVRDGPHCQSCQHHPRRNHY